MIHKPKKKFTALLVLLFPIAYLSAQDFDVPQVFMPSTTEVPQANPLLEPVYSDLGAWVPFFRASADAQEARATWLSDVGTQNIPLRQLSAQIAPGARIILEGADDKLLFSRVLKMKEGELLEIPYRGVGWVYLGEINAQSGLSYSSRRVEPEGSSFIFRADKIGTYNLKFYRQDFIRDYILNDYVQVIVEQMLVIDENMWPYSAVEAKSVIAQPRWPSASEEAAAFAKAKTLFSLPAQMPDETAAQDAVTVPLTPEPLSNQTEVQTIPAAVSTVPGQQTAQEPLTRNTTPVVESAPPLRQVLPPVPSRPNTTVNPRPQTQPLPVQQVPKPAPADKPTVEITVSDPAQDWQPESAQAASDPKPAELDVNIEMPSEQSTGTPAAVVPPAPSNVLSAAALIEKAYQEFEQSHIDSALALLDQLSALTPAGTDKAWWLYGQLYEADSPARDIRTSLGYYRRLVNEFPQSPYYDKAHKRISYLERFYFNIQ
ncbi:outer membrane protein assembly factor BamD [Breznakiellaceae bacterium SP9]